MKLYLLKILCLYTIYIIYHVIRTYKMYEKYTYNTYFGYVVISQDTITSVQPMGIHYVILGSVWSGFILYHFGYLQLFIREHRKPIPKNIRDAVWNRYIGSEINSAKCPLCLQADINRTGNYSWHCSHVKSHADGGKNTVENLRVLCPPCNIRMGKIHMMDYCKRYDKKSLKRLKLT
jgi:hypothetical protein